MIDVWSSGASDTPIILCALKACDAHADRAVFAKDEITASDAPFLPEQGVSAAIASRAEIPSAAPITKHRLRDTLRSSLGELFILAYKGSPTKTARPLSPSHPVGGDQLRAADLSGRWMTRRRSKHSPIASSATASSLVVFQLLTL